MRLFNPTRRPAASPFRPVSFRLVFLVLLSQGCGTAVEPDLAAGLRARQAPGHTAPSTGSDGCVSGRQTSGALYEICLPEAGVFNRTLVLYAHGFIFPQLPLHVPEVEGGIQVASFVTGRGFAYAATSYYTNGIVDPNQGTEDLLELVDIYTKRYGRPEHVLLLGFSNGAFLSTLALEKNADRFDGALASCGPVGSYREQIHYLGDIFVLFDFFFRDVEVIPGMGHGIPGGPDGIPQGLIDHLAAVAPQGNTAVDVLAQYVLAALQDHPKETQQLLGTIQSTAELAEGLVLFQTTGEGVELVLRAIAYYVFAANDALAKFGGRFFDNSSRIYGDLLPDPLLRQAVNAEVQRYRADANAAAHLAERYGPKGHLHDPVVALHNTRDPLVPFWQELLYLEKLGSRTPYYTLQAVDGYGHCNFTEEQLGSGLEMLLHQVAAQADLPL